MFQGHIDLDTATRVQATAIPDVLFERGLYWASGRSGVVNLVAAHKWFNLAALKGRADAIPLRREVAAMMSEVEIATAQREARTWMTTN
jgi:TPR repeat protein